MSNQTTGKVYVSAWEPIKNAPEPEISGREKQRVASVFSQDEWDYVVWVPEWVLEDKDIDMLESFYRLAVGDVEDYSEKAWRFDQPHRPDKQACFLPKSAVTVFERGVGIEEIETPQQGLDQFGGDA